MMTKTDLAKLSGYSLQAISMILSGKRDAGRKGAARLAKAVPGTTILDWLFAKHNHKRLAKKVKSA